ncbi:type II/IV secretion system protein [Candidatus Kaiserbacteria bacterium]|nr:type II/IV secretion system protein [Candidatus Kaiserbacteria bacterium]
MDVLSLLSKKGLIAERAIAAIKEEVSSGGKTLERALLDRGVSAGDILAARGEYYQTPTRELEDEQTVPYEVLRYVPEESARHFRFAPLAVNDGVLEVGTTDPDNLEALEALNFIAARVNLPYKLFLISDEDFDRIIGMYKGLTGEVGVALNELETSISEEPSLDLEQGAPEKPEQEGKEGKRGEPMIKEDAPVTKIVGTILRYAVDGKASDIHIEPAHDELKVRFRIDGVLYTNLKLPKNVERAVIARIKVLASLKLDERRKPQDGRFSATVDNRRIDFRVSTFPTYHGEKVVMRILDRKHEVMTLESLGLTKENVDILQKAIARPYGIIIISGPTGSGKSTTLYAMLEQLNRETMNVVSLEDPVEYDVEGVAQSQVRPEIGYTFANGLRSILRQDPDIIMVGEIRDKETAQLAIQAALTGHLVLTTLHTNNAIGIVPRLVDMGVDPFLIAPTLILSMAQRLVRKRCEDAGKQIPFEGALKKMLEKEFEDLPPEFAKRLPKTDHVYGIAPSATCPNGTKGRIGVFEMLPTSKELESVILEKPIEEELYKVARAEGMFTMKEDAIMKMLDGVIPFEEVNTLGGDLLKDEEA